MKGVPDIIVFTYFIYCEGFAYIFTSEDCQKSYQKVIIDVELLITYQTHKNGHLKHGQYNMETQYQKNQELNIHLALISL